MPAGKIAPQELKDRLDRGEPLVVLDVREAWEVEFGKLPNSIWIPFDEVKARIAEVPAGKALVVACHHGVRSAFAARALADAGFDEVYNLTGGVDRWAREVDPDFPTY
ncbi:MAG TPA: rhodanese-like domain-containing protein [Candidatus Thermoplasmatota archaeon]|nr:rhodanese-like domain-containing protein [Candidatus Thermoplasmatota archaeon]